MALVAAALAVGAGCGDSGGGLEGRARRAGRERAEQASEAAREAGLSEAVASVIGDAAGAVGQTFTVTYDTGGGGRAILVQAPPLRRFDIMLPDGVTRRTLVNEEGSFACELRGGAWTCAPSGDPPPEIGPFAATDLERTIGSLSSAQASFDLRVERRQVAGVEARCLVTERKPSAAADPTLGERGALCVAPSGAALSIDQPGQALTAVAYDASVEDGAFALPGPLLTTTSSPRPTG
jgi:hypothetical protein